VSALHRRGTAAAARGGVGARPGSEQQGARSRPAFGRAAAATALPRRAHSRSVWMGTHKTRRSGCRARCCLLSHMPPVPSSSCKRHGGPASAPTRRTALRRPTTQLQRVPPSAQRQRAADAPGAECTWGRVQPAERTRLFSDSISRYFMRPALAPWACDSERCPSKRAQKRGEDEASAVFEACRSTQLPEYMSLCRLLQRRTRRAVAAATSEGGTVADSRQPSLLSQRLKR